MPKGCIRLKKCSVQILQEPLKTLLWPKQKLTAAQTSQLTIYVFLNETMAFLSYIIKIVILITKAVLLHAHNGEITKEKLFNS